MTTPAILSKPTPRPVFIFGCPRSGTSLMSRVVGSHARIGIPFESHIYHYLYMWERYYQARMQDRKWWRPLVADILGMEDIRSWNPRPDLDRTVAAIRRPDLHGLFEGLFEAWATSLGKPRWGDKTPQHTLNWRALVEAFPDLQVIYLMRDGRDVALSYKRAFFGPKHAYSIAKRWLHYVQIGEELEGTLDTPRFHRVQYEALVAEPERTVRGICNFLREDYDPAMLDSHRSDVPYPTDSRNALNLRKPILANNSGKWRQEMSARDLRIFEAVAGNALEQYGYERGVPGARISSAEALSCRFIEHPPRKAISMMQNIKSQKIQLQRMRIYLRLRLGL